MIPRYLMRFFCLSFFLVLCACNDGKNGAQQYINKVKNEAPKPLAPQAIPVENFSSKFQSHNIRNPFSTSAPLHQSKNYPNSILQQYTLDALHLVGILQREGKSWALISAPDEKIYRISIGSRIGNQQSLVTKISENKVYLVIEADGNQARKESVLVLQKH